MSGGLRGRWPLNVFAFLGWEKKWLFCEWSGIGDTCCGEQRRMGDLEGGLL